MKPMCVFVAAAVIIIIMLLAHLLVQQRHYWDQEGEQRCAYLAWAVTFPGYETVYTPENVMDLRKWVGTGFSGLSAKDAGTGEENPEATAGLALLLTGAFPSYTLKKQGENFVLYRSASERTYFTWRSHYRLTAGKRLKPEDCWTPK